MGPPQVKKRVKLSSSSPSPYSFSSSLKQNKILPFLVSKQFNAPFPFYVCFFDSKKIKKKKTYDLDLKNPSTKFFTNILLTLP
jgi:hypothetical protein